MKRAQLAFAVFLVLGAVEVAYNRGKVVGEATSARQVQQLTR